MTAREAALAVEQLSAAFHMAVIPLEDLRACAPAFELLSFPEARRRSCVVVRSPTEGLLAVLADPCDGALQDWLEYSIREPFSYRLARSDEISAYLVQREETLRAMEGVEAELIPQTTTRSEAQDVSIEAIGQSDGPVVKLVTSTLYDAIKIGASDIHLETSAAGLTVKYRIDGVLSVVKTLDGAPFADQVISRIKVMAELDIAERRVPQDGRFRARSSDRDIDLRVSVMPNAFGEDAVLRILDKRALSDQLRGLTLERLGLEPAIAQSLRVLSREPHGMLLVTGPTGSGKTTTLYAVISEVNNGREKIITIEDPVEYQLPGVLQIPVNEKKGLTFARGLRSILRHDPDRIMVGEIRDPETAEIAVQSALTGHLVYTTVHANNVYDVIGRFAHMGSDVFNLASALNAVMAQRLVRLLCTECRGNGCGYCHGAGYRGRKAVAELLIVNDEIRELIATRAPARRVRDAARVAGAVSLRDAAAALANRGETTMEEVDRVAYTAR